MSNAPKALLTRAATFETRATDDDGFTLEGYAAVFDSPTLIDSWEGTFEERIAPGAFAKTIQERTPVVQFDHGHDIATGSVPIAAIQELREDKQGLFVSARMFDNPRVEPIRQAIAGGAIDGMSFRFQVIKEEWADEGDLEIRTIRELALYELGPVVFPAYEATSVGVRSLLADIPPSDRAALLQSLGVEAARMGTSIDAETEAGSTTSAPKVRDPRAVQTLAAAHRGRRHNPTGEKP